MFQNLKQKYATSRELIVLLLATVLTLAIMYVPQPLLSSIQKAYPTYSDTEIALLMTCILGPLSIAPLVYGTLLSSFTTKRILFVCVGFLAVTSLSLYISTSFEAILFWRLVQGLAVPAMLTGLMAHLSMHYSGIRLQHVMAIYVAATIVGGLLGRIFSGVIASVWGWQSAFLVFGVALVLLFFLVSTVKAHPNIAYKHFTLKEFNQILHTKGIKRLLCIEGGCFFVFMALTTYLPFHLTKLDSNMPEWRIGLVYVGYGIGIFIALKSHTIIHAVGGSIRSMRLGIGIFLCSLILFIIPSVYSIFIGIFALCAGQFLEHSINPGLVNRICPHNKNVVNGLYISVYYLGGALGSYMPGIIFDYFGWSVFVSFLALVLLAVLFATLGLQKHTPQE